MTSITGTQSHVATGPFRAPEFTFPARVRSTAGVVAALVGRSFAAARAYEAAQSSTARRAVLAEFARTR